MSLVDFAQHELELAGLFSKESDYDGMLGDSVLELVKTFAAQGHSGFSAGLTTEIFTKLSKYEPLSPITSNPDEWMNVAEYFDGNGVWQCRRNPSLFSRDGGKTWYHLNDPAQDNGDTFRRDEPDNA
jgi:hypothetical protein